MSKADEIEEAKKILNRIDIKFFLSGTIEQSNYIVDKANEINIAIKTVLEDLEKCEHCLALDEEMLDYKDKIIDKMSEALTTPIHGKEWVKEYFEKEVSEENARNR